MHSLEVTLKIAAFMANKAKCLTFELLPFLKYHQITNTMSESDYPSADIYVIINYNQQINI